MPTMTGARFLAETVHGYGITHVFFMPYIAPRALMEMERLGIQRVQTHGEKAAAYMADAYARIKRGPGLCMAQSVGALESGCGPAGCLSSLLSRPCAEPDGRTRSTSNATLTRRLTMSTPSRL